jgi:uncharacterized protein YndB with AHSA1/START domain
MDHAHDVAAGQQPAPLVISRTLFAPRNIVFQAWSSADHIKNWFAPKGFTVPVADVDFRPGGVCNILMRSPHGQDSWSRGEYLEIAPPERLVMSGHILAGGDRKVSVRTIVTFEADHDRTHLTVQQIHTVHDPAFMSSVAGAAEGWRNTLDKLDEETQRMQQATARSVVHGSFSIHRQFRAKPPAVFAAFSDMGAKARWFTGPETFSTIRRELDFRVGGSECLAGRWEGGTVTRFDATYFDIIPNERLVYTYEMRLNDRKISVSLATIELREEDGGTHLTVTEQGAFLDGYDDAGSREQGTAGLLDRLAQSLGETG